MKLRDVLKRIEDDGWFQVTQKEVIASSSTQANGDESRLPAIPHRK
jgi:hypothetical protein